MNTFQLYLRKTGRYQEKQESPEAVKRHCLVKRVQEEGILLEFLSQENLAVELDSLHYYVRRIGATAKPELWLIEFFPAKEKRPPYTYIAARIEKYRDVPSDWLGDDCPA